MTRLHAEFRRLFLPHALAEAPVGEPGLADITATAALADRQGRVRALVLELARPADWPALATVWRGVQAELGLPAPAVAVNGGEGLQLWFSVAQPVGMDEAQAFLEGLRQRWLSDLPPPRVGLLPRAGDGPGALQWAQAAAVLAQQEQAPGCWPAFIAPDLAAVFADTPWLDLPPGDEGQADLLAGLHSIAADAWQAALQALAPPPPAPGAAAAGTPPGPAAMPATAHAGDGSAQAAAERFLLSVMNDTAAPLALRIDAAKALVGARRPA